MQVKETQKVTFNNCNSKVAVLKSANHLTKNMCSLVIF